MQQTHVAGTTLDLNKVANPTEFGLMVREVEGRIVAIAFEATPSQIDEIMKTYVDLTDFHHESHWGIVYHNPGGRRIMEGNNSECIERAVVAMEIFMVSGTPINAILEPSSDGGDPLAAFMANLEASVSVPDPQPPTTQAGSLPSRKLPRLKVRRVSRI